MVNSQVTLYLGKKTEIPDTLRRELLHSFRRYLGKGEIIEGAILDRLITPELEILISPLGCCEIYGDPNSINDFLPKIVSDANSKGLPYYWLFFDTREKSELKENIITNLRTKSEFKSIIVCGVN